MKSMFSAYKKNQNWPTSIYLDKTKVKIILFGEILDIKKQPTFCPLGTPLS
jgi:hypothetical protein